MSGTRPPRETTTHNRAREVSESTATILQSTNGLLRNLGEDRAKKIESKLSRLIARGQAFHVTIIGGGEAGVHTALALAKMKLHNDKPLYYVTIIDKHKELMQGTSRITPGRAGQGYHYAHADTSIMCQEHTMAFMHAYPDYVIGSGLEKNHPIRRGRYVVMKTSVPAPLEVFRGYKKSHSAYQARVEENIRNKIWGEPDNFLKLLYVAEDQIELKADAMAPSKAMNIAAGRELEKTINLDEVAFVVETAEELIDMKRYRAATLAELSSYENIRIETEKEILNMEHLGNQRFSICFKDLVSNQINYMQTDYPVICAAERAEYLLNDLDISSPTKETTTNRLKSIITVDLPEELQTTNSYFFCMGAYMMFSNMGDGTGKVTYAPVTNMGKADAAGSMPLDMEMFLSGWAEPALQEEIGRKILAGASIFMPALTKATLKRVDFGIVKVRGSSDQININDPQGKIGERDYGWVKKHAVDGNTAFIVQNDAMKIVYSLQNALDTRYLINEGLYLKYKEPSVCNQNLMDCDYNSILLNLQNNQQSSNDCMLVKSGMPTPKASPMFRPTTNSSMPLRPGALLFAPDRSYTPSLFESKCSLLSSPVVSQNSAMLSCTDSSSNSSISSSPVNSPSLSPYLPPKSAYKKDKGSKRKKVRNTGNEEEFMVPDLLDLSASSTPEPISASEDKRLKRIQKNQEVELAALAPLSPRLKMSGLLEFPQSLLARVNLPGSPLFGDVMDICSSGGISPVDSISSSSSSIQAQNKPVARRLLFQQKRSPQRSFFPSSLSPATFPQESQQLSQGGDGTPLQYRSRQFSQKR